MTKTTNNKSTSLQWAQATLTYKSLLLPLRPPTTGLPKCSGWVRGSWSRVSLSAKCLPLLRHKADLLKVVISPSSNTGKVWNDTVIIHYTKDKSVTKDLYQTKMILVRVISEPILIEVGGNPSLLFNYKTEARGNLTLDYTSLGMALITFYLFIDSFIPLCAANYEHVKC